MATAKAKYEIRAEDRTERGLRQARNRLAAFGRTAVARLAGPIAAAAAGVAAIGTAAVRAASDLDRLAKSASDVGASVEEARSADLAAELGGADLETLINQLGILSRNAKEATEGNKEYAETFRQLRIDAGRFLQLDLEEQAVTVARALQDLEQREGRGARVGAQRQLGIRRAGRLFRDPDELRANFAEARRLNLLEGLEDRARAGEALTDARSRLGAVASDIGQRTLSIFFEPLTKLINKAADVLAVARPVPEQQGRFVNVSGAPQTVEFGPKATRTFNELATKLRTYE